MIIHLNVEKLRIIYLEWRDLFSLVAMPTDGNPICATLVTSSRSTVRCSTRHTTTPDYIDVFFRDGEKSLPKEGPDLVTGLCDE